MIPMRTAKDFNPEEESRNFLNEFPMFSAEAARAFCDTYYEGEGTKGTKGSKYSERVFKNWISNALQNKISDEEKISKSGLKIGGEVISDSKKPDMYIKRNSDGKRVLIEFKCNIDMVEKDLFKIYFNSDNDCKYILFIWEHHDHSKSRRNPNEYSSYLKILNSFKKHALSQGINFDFIYMPIYTDENETAKNGDVEEKFNQLIKAILYDEIGPSVASEGK